MNRTHPTLQQLPLMAMLMYYSRIVSQEMMCFLRLMLVSAFLIVFGLNQFSQASTTEEDPSAEVKQQEYSNPSVTSAAELKKRPATANHGGLLSSDEKQSGIVDKLYQKIDHVQHRFSNLLAYGMPLPPKDNMYVSMIHFGRMNWSILRYNSLL